MACGLRLAACGYDFVLLTNFSDKNFPKKSLLINIRSFRGGMLS